MRRSAITSFTASLLFALIAACATGAGDDPSVAFQPSEVKAPTEPTGDVKLPPPSTTSAPEDAGVAPKDAGNSLPQDSGSPQPQPQPQPQPTTPDCTTAEALAKLFLGATPTGACPCSAAGQCCFSGQCL